MARAVPSNSRASRACHSCRKKKIKCKVVQSGVPCDNCRVYSSECIISISKRRKKYLIEDNLSGHPSASKAASAEPDDPQEVSVLDDFLQKAPMSLDFTTSTYLQQHAVPEYDMTVEEEMRQPSIHSHPSDPNTSWTADALAISRQPQAPLDFPNFLRPMSPSTSAEDIVFLEHKGALSIPPVSLRNDLLQKYVQYVHPFLPMIDIEDTLQQIQNNGSPDQVSLLLFQAMMFAATAYVDLQLVNEAGYSDRKAMRKVFFQKVKLLYDFDYEPDRLVTLQAILLMTYWYETPTDQKDAWHWIGVALCFAFDSGLHHSAAPINADPKKWRLRKRLWWCCYMRDRLLAMSMRKTPRIKSEDYDMPMLILEDFNIQPFSPVLANMIGDFVSTTTMTTRSTLAALCIEQAKLCFCIGLVLSLQFLESNEALRSTDENVMMLRPRVSVCAAELAKVIECDQQLVEWYDGLPADCHHEIRRQDPADEHHGCDDLLIHRILLRMLYSTTVCTLHRPQIRPNMATDPMAKGIHRVSCQNVKGAASDIARLAQELDERKLSGFLPPLGVTVLVPAMVVHLLETRSGDENVRKTGWSQFDQCSKVLQRLQESYPSADVAFALLQLALAKVSPGTRPKTQQEGVHSSNGMIDGRDMCGTDAGPYSIQAVQVSMHGANDADEHSSREQHQPIETLAQAPTDAADVLTASHTGLPDYTDDVFDALVDFDAWSGLFIADDGAPVDFDIGNTLQFSQLGA